MDRKASPDNHIRRVMDMSLPGLEDDLYFEERVLHRIRALERPSARAKGKLSRGLAVALALVLLTAAAVTLALARAPQRVPASVAASTPERDAPGFTEVTATPSVKPASGNVCEFRRQSTRQEC